MKSKKIKIKLKKRKDLLDVWYEVNKNKESLPFALMRLYGEVVNLK